jgi:hypothetical protein
MGVVSCMTENEWYVFAGISEVSRRCAMRT